MLGQTANISGSSHLSGGRLSATSEFANFKNSYKINRKSVEVVPPVKEDRLVSKKPTADTNGNKKNDVESTKMVSNSNTFDVLISGENDVDLGTNGGTSNLKVEKLIIDGKVTLVDDEGEPMRKVDYPGDHDSEDEVASVDNDMARSMASEKFGFGNTSLLEQWRDTYENGDYDYDPYDDDMYEGQEIPDKIQAICDNLDIKCEVARRNSLFFAFIV
ncbi:hypothetical protein Tco_0645864 [Tanacetum coccineum]